MKAKTFLIWVLFVWAVLMFATAVICDDRAFAAELGNQRHEYQAIVCDVYDGDTITVDINLGLGVWLHYQKIRLLGINAPEMRGDEKPAGILARDYLCKRICARQVVLRTDRDKKGKYGRLLAEVWMLDAGQWKLINDEMVTAGHAVHKEY